MSELLEICMVVCFGFSWPMSVLKSYRARTAKGKSLFFLVMICIGIAAKLTAPTFKWYVLFFYVLNLIMVSCDLVLYFRNRRLDREKAASEA